MRLDLSSEEGQILVAFDFLTEPLVEARLGAVQIRLTLPGLFAKWASGDDVALEGIRRHQSACMHMFLVQAAVGGLCLSDTGSELDVGEEVWRQRLFAVAIPEAWHLVAETENAPALMQPAIPIKHLSQFTSVYNADALTVLIASKNHFLKQNVMTSSSAWQWLCALIEVQTLSGYSGRSNYGIIRMNGGLGSRPLVSVYPDMREGARWKRDTSRYFSALDTGPIPEGLSGSATAGLVATWTRAWNGREQIKMADLHPAFIEVARRVRLQTGADGTIFAKRGNSDAARIMAPKTLCGRTGDPWAPLDGPEKILTVSWDGWSLRRLRYLIVDGYIRSILQEPGRAECGDLFFHASVITRGQGKTEGFHEVTIPIPGKVVISLAQTFDGRPRLGVLSAEMSDDAQKATSALRCALVTFLHGGLPPSKKADRKEADDWVVQLQATVKDAFFPTLWEGMDRPNRSGWRSFLRTAADELYEEAVLSLATRDEVFYRAYTKGKEILNGELNAEFADTALKRRRRTDMSDTETDAGKAVTKIALAINAAWDGRCGCSFLSPAGVSDLKRMATSNPAAAFWYLMAQYVPKHLREGKEIERRWALICQGIAWMAPNSHDARQSPGQALAATQFSSEASPIKINRLLRAENCAFEDLFLSACRFLAAKEQPIDWRSMGSLALNQGDTERKRLARDFYIPKASAPGAAD